jgi:hypothetical protein
MQHPSIITRCVQLFHPCAISETVSRICTKKGRQQNNAKSKGKSTVKKTVGCDLHIFCITKDLCAGAERGLLKFGFTTSYAACARLFPQLCVVMPSHYRATHKAVVFTVNLTVEGRSLTSKSISVSPSGAARIFRGCMCFCFCLLAVCILAFCRSTRKLQKPCTIEWRIPARKSQQQCLLVGLSASSRGEIGGFRFYSTVLQKQERILSSDFFHLLPSLV